MNEVQPNHLLQIDLLKGFAIISVIIIHSSFDVISSFSVFYIWQAVPIFIVLMGLNSGMSLNRKISVTIKSLISEKYFHKKIRRLIVPYLIFVLIAIIIWIVKKECPLFTNPDSNYIIVTILHYYLAIVIQFIFVFPLLYIL
jgi:peptidoglycan/LPS O-acetylase OafA/YrhL